MGRRSSGSPGPLVHTLESLIGEYESFLEAWFAESSSFLSVWMINRILNTNRSHAQRWLALLRSVIDHDRASHNTKDLARRFMERGQE